MTANHRFHPRISRRGVLAGLGAAAALAPFLPMRLSRAEEAPPVKRLILLFSGNGTIPSEWEPDGQGADFTLRKILTPLAAHKDDLIVVKGLKMIGGGAGSNHMQGSGKLWTGTNLLDGDEFSGGGGAKSGWGGGISIDQHIVKETAPPTQYSSLELGVRTGDADVRSRQSYRGANDPVPPKDNPYDVFDRLFGGLVADPAELAALRSRRKSVLDAVLADLEVMKLRHGAADRAKVEQHLERLRTVEARLTEDQQYAGACEAPTLTQGVDWKSEAAFPKVSRLMLDQLVMALTCDMTRVATLAWGRATSMQKYPWLDINEAHHDISHKDDTTTTVKDKLVKINAWHAGELAYLIDQLKAVPDGDGTLFDSTLIVWGNELGRGSNHSMKNIPFVLAGSAGGVFKTGRYHDVGEVAHNRLLVSIGRAFGLDELETFGGADDGTGGLDVLTTG